MVSPIVAWGNSEMSPRYYSIEKTFFRSLYLATIIFENTITLQKDVVPMVYCGDEVVATGKLLCDNYNNEGFLEAHFEPIYLPKGKDYRLYLPAGVVASEKDPTMVNGEINYEFTVPEYLPWCDYSIAEGSVVVSSETVVFHFHTDFNDSSRELPENYKVVLYRGDVPVRRIYSEALWDWDIGRVVARFGKKVNFEKGVNYSLVLPEGAVHSMYRDDIVNKEERIDFVGGYEQPFPELKQAWCSLNESETVEVLNEAQWGYTQRVALSLAPQIELRTDADELLKAVIPTLAEVEGEWVMTADFENYAIDPNQVYHLVIPESTVVTPEGDVVVNKETILRIANGVVGIDNATHNTLAMACVNNQLHIEGTNAGDHLALYTIDGKTITTQSAQGTSVVMELPHKGLFIVVVNGKAHKVVNG